MTTLRTHGTGERYQMVRERAKLYQYTNKMTGYGVRKLSRNKADGTCNEGPGPKERERWIKG